SYVDREHMLTSEHPLQALRAGEFDEGIAEEALAEAEQTAGVPEHDLSPWVGGRAQRLFGATELALSILEASQPHERCSGHGERAGRHRLAGPAMLLGDRE